MLIAAIILVVLFCIVAGTKEDIRDSDILVKLSLFSVMSGCIGIIGEEFISGSYIVTVISSIIFIMCIIVGFFKMIFGIDIGHTGRLIVFFTFLAIVFELLARLNNVLNLGMEYVSLMIKGRTISIILILIVLLIKSFNMIFLRKDTEYPYIENE